MLRQKILQRDGDILLYGITPPKRTTPQERLIEIAAEQARRINAIDPDGVVLYDIQDEAMRNPTPRPFPFLETVDPLAYGRDFLKAAAQSRICYRAVGKYPEDVLRADLANLGADATVFVGAASRLQRRECLHPQGGDRGVGAPVPGDSCVDLLMARA